MNGYKGMAVDTAGAGIRGLRQKDVKQSYVTNIRYIRNYMKCGIILQSASTKGIETERYRQKGNPVKLPFYAI